MPGAGPDPGGRAALPRRRRRAAHRRPGPRAVLRGDGRRRPRRHRTAARLRRVGRPGAGRRPVVGRGTAPPGRRRGRAPRRRRHPGHRDRRQGRRRHHRHRRPTGAGRPGVGPQHRAGRPGPPGRRRRLLPRRPVPPLDRRPGRHRGHLRRVLHDAMHATTPAWRCCSRPPRASAARRSTDRAARQVLGALRSRYEVVRGRLRHPDAAAPTPPPWRLADMALLVTTPDVVAVRAAKRQVRLWDRLQIRKAEDTTTVVNRLTRQHRDPAPADRQGHRHQVARDRVPAAFKELQPVVDAGRMHELDGRSHGQAGAVGAGRRTRPGRVAGRTAGPGQPPGASDTDGAQAQGHNAGGGPRFRAGSGSGTGVGLRGRFRVRHPVRRATRLRGGGRRLGSVRSGRSLRGGLSGAAPAGRQRPGAGHRGVPRACSR